MFDRVPGIRVAGVAAAVSGRWQAAEELSDEDPAVLQKFIKKTGVTGRWSASQRQTASDFCFAAAEALLREKGVPPEKIGVLVFVTQSADYRMPSTAYVLQHRLGVSKNCAAFDVNLGCSGFVYGMSIVSALLSASDAEYGLLLAGDTAAREFSPKRRERTGHTAGLLFGDAGSATLLMKDPAAEALAFSLNADGDGFRAIYAPYAGWRNPDGPGGCGHGSRMDEVGVFNFATAEAPDQLNAYMARAGKTAADYDCLVLHQANLMIMKRIAKKTGFPEEKMPVSMDRFGNTSSASIPLTLVDAYAGRPGGETVRPLCCGFGVGLSWGTVGFAVARRDILPLVHTDDYFEDGAFYTE